MGPLIFATSGVQLANGFFGTFISLRVGLENFSSTAAGLVLSSFFAGYTIGALYCIRIIERTGHIRAYAAFAGIAVAASAAMPLLVVPAAWCLMRALIGFGCAGLFLTTEAWLNAKSAPEKRGRVFSIYMVGTFVALAIGQVLIGQIEIRSGASFNIIILILAVALALVCTTRAEAPQITLNAPLPYGLLARGAPVAAAGALLTGLASGAFYALVPAWMQKKGNDPATIGLVMLAAVLGGLAFQVPAGRLSDRYDRRLVLLGLCLGLAGASAVLAYLPPTRIAVLPTAIVFGGFLSTLYPVCVAHAHDRMDGDQVVPVSGRLILLTGVGSVVGPLLGSIVMADFGIDGVLFLIATTALVLSLISAASYLVSKSPQAARRSSEMLTPQAAVVGQDSFGV